MRWRLPDDHRAAGTARATIAREVGDREGLDDIELVVSELVSNAVDHGAPPITLELLIESGCLRITVRSLARSGTPQMRQPSGEDSRGRGLAIVESLASRWGWARDDDEISVWAEFASD